MKSTTKQFQEQLNTCGLMPIIEMQSEQSKQWYLWDIKIYDNGWITAQGDKDFSIRVDCTFSLDEHLQSLCEDITNFCFEN